jgi:hypothetical protein
MLAASPRACRADRVCLKERKSVGLLHADIPSHKQALYLLAMTRTFPKALRRFKNQGLQAV